MGIDKFVQFAKDKAKDVVDARNLRLKDPTIQAKLDAERMKTQEAWAEAGGQTLNTLSRIVWNSTGGLVGKDPAGRVHSGAVDSTKAVGSLVGKVLVASGRTAWYGIRKGIVK